MPAPSYQDLTTALEGLGWTLDGVDSPSSSTPKYTATATGPDGKKKLTRDGETPEYALSNLVAFAQRHNQIRAYAAFQKETAWDLPWEHQLEEIGKAYGELPVHDPKAIPHWQALAQESKIQADAIRRQLKVNVTDDPEPYPHVGAMIHDIHHKGNFTVSRAHSDHPIWSMPDNVNFRIVHDVLGHGQTGGDFGWNGENKACSIHFPMISKMARPALFTECIGQTAYALRKGSHGFGPQKIGVMNQFLDPVEKMNGEHVYIPHGKFAYPEEIMGEQGGGAAAHGWYQDPQTGIWKQDPNATDTYEPGAAQPAQNHRSHRARVVIADVASDLSDPETGEKLWDDNHQMFRGVDPNQGYTTPADVTQRGVGGTGHPDYNGDQVRAGTPSDYIDRKGTYSNTAKMVVPWWERDANGAWKYPVAAQEKIILNAIRVCLLSPLKNLKWNAAHYQGIADMPVTATGREMWDKLDGIRRRHNQDAGFDEAEHLGYFKEIKVLAGFIQYETGKHMQEALKDAKQRVYAKLRDFEGELTHQHAQGNLKLESVPGEWSGEDEDTDENGITPLRIYLQAHHLVDQWIKGLVQQRSPEPNAERGDSAQQMNLLARVQKMAATLGDDQMGLEGVTPTKQKGKKYEKYAGFMGTHLDGIANAAKYIPELRQAALKDIYTDGGRGFVFRNAFMNLKQEYGIVGVNPKVISFIWLMLYPEGSDLGIVDTHVARAFNRDYAQIGSLKDYYKMERMQKAIKDSSGYPDMPLGTFHHGMWDLVRSKDWRKGVEHSDHTPLAVDDPTPWDMHPWNMDTGNAKLGNWTGPQPFEYARPLAEEVAGRYEAQYNGQAKNRIPYDVLEDMTKQRAANKFYEPYKGPHGGYNNTGDVVCAGCGKRTFGDRPKCRHCGHAVTGKEEKATGGYQDWGALDKTAAEMPWEREVKKLAPVIQVKRYIDQAGGNPVAAQKLLAADLVQQHGKDEGSAWTIAERLIDNHQRAEAEWHPEGVGNTDMSEFEPPTVPEEWHSEHERVDDGKCPYCNSKLIQGGQCLGCGREIPRGTPGTDMSDFENRPTTDPEDVVPSSSDWGPSEEHPEDFNPNPKPKGEWCYKCGTPGKHETRRDPDGKRFYHCENCGDDSMYNYQRFHVGDLVSSGGDGTPNHPYTGVVTKVEENGGKGAQAISDAMGEEGGDPTYTVRFNDGHAQLLGAPALQLIQRGGGMPPAPEEGSTLPNAVPTQWSHPGPDSEGEIDQLVHNANWSPLTPTDAHMFVGPAMTFVKQITPIYNFLYGHGNNNVSVNMGVFATALWQAFTIITRERNFAKARQTLTERGIDPQFVPEIIEQLSKNVESPSVMNPGGFDTLDALKESGFYEHDHCSDCGAELDGDGDCNNCGQGQYAPGREDWKVGTQHDPAAEEALDWDMEEPVTENEWELASDE